MTQRSSKSNSELKAEPGNPFPKDRRDLFIKVFVNEAEKADIVKQKGRLSFSAFLRDRGLTRGGVYDPTYAAIGGVYQSVRNLRDSAEGLREVSIALQNSATGFQTLSASDVDTESNRATFEDLRELATQLRASADRIETQANTLGERAGELGQKHTSEMLKRYPAKEIVPRKGR